MYINFENKSEYSRNGVLPLSIAEGVNANTDCDIFIQNDKLVIKEENNHKSAFIVCKRFAPVSLIRTDITIILIDKERMLLEVNSGAVHIEDENGKVGLVSIDTNEDEKIPMFFPETMIYVDNKLNPMVLPYHAPEEYAEHEEWFNGQFDAEVKELKWKTAKDMEKILECFCHEESKYPFEFAFGVEILWNYYKGADNKKVTLDIKPLSVDDISNGQVQKRVDIKNHMYAKQRMEEMMKATAVTADEDFDEYDNYDEDEENDDYYDNFYDDYEDSYE